MSKSKEDVYSLLIYFLKQCLFVSVLHTCMYVCYMHAVPEEA